MELIIVLIVAGLMAWLGVEMAKTRNRDTKTWGILCFMFGLFAVLVLALIGTAKE
jgi:hypothetical protein